MNCVVVRRNTSTPNTRLRPPAPARAGAGSGRRRAPQRPATHRAAMGEGRGEEYVTVRRTATGEQVTSSDLRFPKSFGSREPNLGANSRYVKALKSRALSSGEGLDPQPRNHAKVGFVAGAHQHAVLEEPRRRRYDKIVRRNQPARPTQAGKEARPVPRRTRAELHHRHPPD